MELPINDTSCHEVIPGAKLHAIIVTTVYPSPHHPIKYMWNFKLV